MKELLIALFDGHKPSVRKYYEFLERMPLEQRGIFCKQTYGIALAEWNELEPAYQLFLIRLIKKERQQFVDYIRKETLLGKFLYEPDELNLLLKVLNLWMQPHKNIKPSYTDISFSLSLTFNTNLSIKYLADKIRYSRMDSFDFAELLEKSNEME